MPVGLLSFAAPAADPDASAFNGGRSETNFQGLEMTFLNIVKDAQEWSTITGGNYVDPDPVIGFNFDVNGYPRRIKTGSGGIRGLLIIPTDGERSWDDVSAGTIGAYTFKWDGGGTVYHSGFTLVSSNTPGLNATSAPGSVNNTITLRPLLSRPYVGVTAVTSSTDYPHNFNVYYTADQADVTAGFLLAKKLRERWAEANFGVARYLNWQAGSLGSGNNNMGGLWDHRKPVDHWSYSAQEVRTAIYAGETTSTVADHYVLSTFNHPIFGTAPAVDKQMIMILANSDQSNLATAYLTYNGREDIICSPLGVAAVSTDPDGNTGTLSAGYYTTLMYDSLLEAWINYGSGNNAPLSRYIQNGAPPEIQLQAAIELGCHPWFLTPTYAADAGTGEVELSDYMPSFIDMVIAGAPAWMKPIWEPCNEWWNSVFYITNWSNARQLVRNGGARPGDTATPYLATSLTQTPVLTVTGTASGTGGQVRLTVASTANLTTGQIRTVSDVGGTVEANGVWPITVIDGTHFELDDSVYANAWTSGGTMTGQTTFQITGALPPLGAQLTGLGAQPTGLSGFSAVTGYVTSVGGSSIIWDKVPAAGSWAGNAATATLTLVGSTVSVPYATILNNTIVFTTTGTLPAPLVAGTIYYVRTTSASGVPFTISLTASGSAIDFSAGSQTGTHTGTLVYAMSPPSADFHNTFGASAAKLGQVLMSKYGVADPKNQTQYRMVLGCQAGAGSYATGLVDLRPRATAKNLVITSGDPANMAKLYATHVSPSNYHHWAAYNRGAPETALANAWNGTLFTAGIVNGVMTVASFQNAGTKNMANGQVVFGFGLPAPFGVNQVTIVSGPGSDVGVYTLSDLTINVDSGTQLYSGTDQTAPAAYIDSALPVQVTATISNGAGAAGNQMVISAITPGGPGFGSTIYLGTDTSVRGAPITTSTTLDSQSLGSAGGVGTYLIPASRAVHVPTSTTFTLGGTADLLSVYTSQVNWKAWAQSFGINKMMFYEGGFSPDYNLAGGAINTSSTTFSKINLLRYAAKWVVSSTGFPTGTYGMLETNYAYCDSLTDGTFTAEYPSSYYLDGRYPSNAAWAIWETLHFPIIPPLVQLNIDYNA